MASVGHRAAVIVVAILFAAACAAAGERGVRFCFTDDARLGRLTNFPVLVTLSEALPGFRYEDVLRPDGYDLRFWADWTRQEELPYEIERWNSAGFSPAHLKGLRLWLKADSGPAVNALGVVTNWADQSCNGNDAVLANGSPSLLTARINGLPAVYFNMAGPVGEYFAFPRIADIRTVVWVVREASAQGFLLGDSSAADFHRGAGGVLWDPALSSPSVRGGCTRLDGVTRDGSSTVLSTGAWHVVSLVTTGNVQANRLVRDRTNNGCWLGDIAEVLVFNRPLDAQEERELGVYLSRKYALSTQYGEGTSCVWVKVPRLARGGSLVATWGDPARTNQPQYTTNGAVWGDGFRGVWHLAGEETSPLPDASGFGNDVATSNSAVVSAMVATGRRLAPGGGLRAADAPSLDLSQSVTMEAWIRLDAWPAERSLVTMKGDGAGNGNYGLWVRDTGDVLLSCWNGMRYDLGTSTREVTPGAWHHIAGVIDTAAGRREIYVDGRRSAWASAPIPSLRINGDDVFHGCRESAWPMDGALDELRLSGAARGSNWIWACCMNQGNGPQFMMPGPVSAGEDHEPPDDIAGVAAIPGDGEVTLTWTNPLAPDFQGVLIIRQCRGLPVFQPQAAGIRAVGDLVAPGAVVVHAGGPQDGAPGLAARWTDRGLRNGFAYGYTLFAMDAQANYSGGVSVRAAPAVDSLAPGEVRLLKATAQSCVALSWINPPDNDFCGVLIVRDGPDTLGGPPVRGHAYVSGDRLGSGTVVCAGAAVPSWPGAAAAWTDQSTEWGTAYRYKVYALDETPNYSPGAEVSVITAMPAVLFVDARASGAGDGSTWADAYTRLDAALDAAAPGTSEIWVAQGVYKPGTNRSDAFKIADGLRLYGGFCGNEATRARRWEEHRTVLSGDIDGDGACNANNSMHVIEANGAVMLDGFTVTMGCADERGGGLQSQGPSTQLRNCVFAENAAQFAGAAVSCRLSGSADSAVLISNCVFQSNVTWSAAAGSGGGAVAVEAVTSAIPVVVVDSVFHGNRAEGGSGGALRLAGVLPDIRRCVFSGNCATGQGVGQTGGGAVSAVLAGCIVPCGLGARVSDCRFSGNQSAHVGGAYALAREVPATVRYDQDVIERCEFYGNTSALNGGAVRVAGGAGMLRDCRFSGNTSGGDGGAVALWDTEAILSDLALCGNLAAGQGGAVFAAEGAPPRIENLLVAGNLARLDGGGLSLQGAEALNPTGWMVNCTIAHNATASPSAAHGGGGLHLSSSGPGPVTWNVWNCILNSNASAGVLQQVRVDGAGLCARVGFSDWEGGLGAVALFRGAALEDCGANLAGPAKFIPGGAGHWTESPLSLAADSITAFTDGAASWAPGELAGRFLQPSDEESMLFLIASNSETTVTVYGSITNAGAGAGYAIRSFELQPECDCVDSGSANQAPPADIQGIPRPVGSGYDRGAYEGMRANIMRGGVLQIR